VEPVAQGEMNKIMSCLRAWRGTYLRSRHASNNHCYNSAVSCLSRTNAHTSGGVYGAAALRAAL